MNCDSSNCGSCYSEYDTDQHVPRILPSCSHTVCSSCLEKLIDQNNQVQCPLCIGVSTIKKSIKDLPTNTKIMLRIEQKSSMEFCSAHKEEVTAVCMIDKAKVCRRCLFSSPHKGHESKSLKEVQMSGKSKKEEFENLLKKYTEDKVMLEKTMIDEEEALKKIVMDGFDVVRENLNKKQESLFSIISSFFAKERQNLTESVKNDSLSIEELEMRILDLSKNTVTAEFIDSFESGLPQLNLETDGKILLKHTSDFKNKLEEALQSFSAFVVSHTQEFKFVFSVKDCAHKTQTTLFEEEMQGQGSQVSESKCFFTFEDNKQRLVVSSQENYSGDSTPRGATLTGDQLNKIREINIRFDKKGAAQEVLEDLQSFWKHLKEVTALKIDFEADEYEESDIINLCLCDFWMKKELTSFSLNLNGCAITDESLSKLSESALPLLSNLTKIALQLNSTKITDQSFAGMIKSLQPRLENLEMLKLELTGTQVTENSLAPIWIAMSNMKVYELDLEGLQIGDKSIEKFAKNSLVAMKNLETLKLNLSDTQVSDESLTLVFMNLPISLRNLSILLSGTKVTSKSIKVLAKKILPNLWNLVNFELNLENTKVIDSKVAGYFADLKMSNSFGVKLNSGDATTDNIEMFIEKKSSGLMSKLKNKLHFK